MSKATLAFGAVAALAIAIPASSIIGDLFARAASPFDRFEQSEQLVLEVKGNFDQTHVYVLDTDLTRQDCLAALPEDHPHLGVYYVCEPDPSGA